jgi:MFS family permease
VLGSLRQVASLLISTFIMMVGFGVAGYVTPLRAMDEGWSMLVISLIATAYSAGFLLSSVSTPLLVRRAGHIRVFAAFIGVLLVAILVAALVVDWRLWIIMRGLAGFAMAGLYMVIETWLNERARNEYRGALFSFYMIICSLGAVVGSFLVPLGNRANTSLFILAALLYAVAIFPIALSAAVQPAPLTRVRINIRQLWRRTPVAFVGSLVAGVLNAGWVHMVAVYATKSGMDAQGGAELQAAVLLGMLALQIPIGRLSDLVDRRIVMVMAGALGVVASFAMTMISPASWLAFNAAAFMLGAVLFPIYTLNSAHANDMAGDGEYVEVAASMGVLYGIGVIAGPLAAGFAMDELGAIGMPVMLAAGFAVYALYALWRILIRPSSLGPAEKTDRQPLASPLQGASLKPPGAEIT